MKLLYMSCHEILEYDELRMLHDLGYECYSLGAYTRPGGAEGRKRPPLPQLPYDARMSELELQYGKHLHQEMLEGMDVVIVMHRPEFIEDNKLALVSFMAGGGRVLWRSIGQSVPWIEALAKEWAMLGIELIRYSPRERTIANYAGGNAIIRFGKYPEDFQQWIGDKHYVVNFTQSMEQRGDHCGLSQWRHVASELPAVLYGPHNESFAEWGGQLTSEELLLEMKHSRALFYGGTAPACYTLSLIEAMMAGLPVIAVGPRLGNSPMYPEQKTYEVHELLPTVDGLQLWFDDMYQAVEALRYLIEDYDLAYQISQKVHERAVELFDATDRIAAQWKDLLG